MGVRERDGQIRTVSAPRSVVPGPAPAPEPYANAPGFAAVVDFSAPMHPPEGAEPLEPVVYGTAGRGGRALHLFVHRRRVRSERRPGIVFVHGGGWAGGGPSAHLRHAHQLAARGWVTANITYRLTSEAPWPAAIEDVKCAIRWMRAHAEELGLDAERIAVGGGSAGGHLAAMAALTPGELEGSGGHEQISSAVAAAVLFYPIADVRTFAEPDATRHFADQLLPGATADELLHVSPVAHVRPGAPPVLTLVGDVDLLTPVRDVEGFHDSLDAAGVVNELVVFQGRDHGFDFHPDDWSLSFDRMCAFLDVHVAGADATTTRPLLQMEGSP